MILRRSHLAFFIAASLAFAAGCGSSSDPAPNADPVDGTPPTGSGHHVSGPIHLDPATSIPSAPAAPAARIAFDAVFAKLPQATCKSQGLSSITATLSKGHYQYANCTLRLIPTALVKGHLHTTVESHQATTGLDPAWTGEAKPVGDAFGSVDVTFRQQRVSHDWSTAPLDLRFDFTDADGHARFTELPLQPAGAGEILVFAPPRLAVDPEYALTVDGHKELHRWTTRRDAAGHSVFRPGDTVGFDAPFTLGRDVDADWVEGSLRVTPDVPVASDTCVFGDLVTPSALSGGTYSAPRVSWDRGDGDYRLSISDASHTDCSAHPPVASPTLVTGSLAFDPRMGGITVAGRYEYRFAGEDLKADIALAGDKDETGAPILVATNVADYAIHAISVTFAAHCEGGADIQAVSHIETVPPNELQGNVVVHPMLAPGQSARFPASVLRDGIAKSDPAAFAACASGRWTIKKLNIFERSPSATSGFGAFDVASSFVITR